MTKQKWTPPCEEPLCYGEGYPIEKMRRSLEMEGRCHNHCLVWHVVRFRREGVCLQHCCH